MIITPKNWLGFQHYKNRRPPWIKLYRSLLDDSEWHCLPDASKALAIMLWLLASESESGEINADSKPLAFRLRTTPQKIKDALNPLIESGFFVASTALSSRLQDAIPETETETETETEASKPKAARKPAPDLPDCISPEVWQRWIDYRREIKKPLSPSTVNAQIAKLCTMHKRGHDPTAIIDESIANSWSGLFEPKINGSNHGNSRFDKLAATAAALTGSSQRTFDSATGGMD